MESSKTHTHEQPLLKRSIVSYRVATDGTTPSRLALFEALSKKEKGTLVITHIYPLQGEHATLVHAHVYADQGAAQRLERANLLAKHAPPAPAAEAQ